MLTLDRESKCEFMMESLPVRASCAQGKELSGATRD